MEWGLGWSKQKKYNKLLTKVQSENIYIYIYSTSTATYLNISKNVEILLIMIRQSKVCGAQHKRSVGFNTA